MDNKNENRMSWLYGFFLILMMGRINIIKWNLVSKSTIRKKEVCMFIPPKNNEKYEKVEN